MYRFLKNILFLLPAESAHSFTMGVLKIGFKIPGVNHLVRRIFTVKNHQLKKSLWGIHFPNPVGLAAGFDKNADYLHELSAFGFGFIEIGTITPKPQNGNPKPRLFRLKKDNALINRMGFNNDGMGKALEKLKKRPHNLIVGGNIGKNKDTPNEQAASDYIACFECLYDHVDYFVINVSSPNTPHLRELQDKVPLSALIESVQIRNRKKHAPKPILLKIAPDLSNEQLNDILEICEATQLDGIIATNTTLSRASLQTDSNAIDAMGSGGLSGAPLSSRSTEIIRILRSKNKRITIIGVGGINDPKGAIEKISAGADLVQIYSGFIFQGPKLVKDINEALIKLADNN
ncbi:MAG: quinone-dependent dihydroorotate dehydrogenase [Flammeovirgaceae bacterium]|jgi:dihydroorotate dehydrogenase|nr:quinone-dependent dihydroorotate dehydrogenase [Flammeovirgaceae bacterium]|tara:strand:- start:6861 stop:7898 length:1038 start_codon:yes stop_codon:yes gene_type:complete